MNKWIPHVVSISQVKKIVLITTYPYCEVWQWSLKFAAWTMRKHASCKFLAWPRHPGIWWFHLSATSSKGWIDNCKKEYFRHIESDYSINFTTYIHINVRIRATQKKFAGRKFSNLDFKIFLSVRRNFFVILKKID